MRSSSRRRAQPTAPSLDAPSSFGLDHHLRSHCRLDRAKIAPRSSRPLDRAKVAPQGKPRSPRSSAKIAEKLMASFLPPKLRSLPSLLTKLMALITPIWREWIVGLWLVSRWWWGSVLWVLGLWVVAGCVDFYWVVVGLLIAIVNVDGLLRWICGGVCCCCCFFFFFNQSCCGGKWWFVDGVGLLRWVCGGVGGFFWYKICLEAEKMWKICGKIAFSECYQILKIVF